MYMVLSKIVMHFEMVLYLNIRLDRYETVFTCTLNLYFYKGNKH